MGLSSASCLCWLKKPSPHKAQARRKTVGSLSDKRGSSSSNAWAGLPLAEMPAFGLGRRGSGGFKRGLVPDDAVYFYRFIIDDIMHRKLSGKECKKKRKRGCTKIYSRVLHATPYEIALRAIDLSDLASRKPHRDHTKKLPTRTLLDLCTCNVPRHKHAHTHTHLARTSTYAHAHAHILSHSRLKA